TRSHRDLHSFPTRRSSDLIEERKLKFASTIEPFLKTYGRDLLNDFYKYWTEPNKSKSKFRQELQKTWDLERRLETWSRNDNNFRSEEHTSELQSRENLVCR